VMEGRNLETIRTPTESHHFRCMKMSDVGIRDYSAKKAPRLSGGDAQVWDESRKKKGPRINKSTSKNTADLVYLSPSPTRRCRQKRQGALYDHERPKKENMRRMGNIRTGETERQSALKSSLPARNQRKGFFTRMTNAPRQNRRSTGGDGLIASLVCRQAGVPGLGAIGDIWARVILLSRPPARATIHQK